MGLNIPRRASVSLSFMTRLSQRPFAILLLSLVLFPSLPAAAQKRDRTPKTNAPPTAAATLLKEITPAPGFDAAIFATSDQANYPVFVSAAPDGTLYVSSDADGSLGRDPHRGRIVRLRDTDGDGRADEVKEFVKDVDSPRGLVWDGDRLYLLHPPHISVYFDRDGDGAAEEEKVLVKNIAFAFKDRPADHTSNGIELGVDGWLYCAIGDFGFMEAEGTDGRKLQCRGGGVVRVRPDGTGLELFSYGTRNILETAVSPLLDIFARDNTNDGGGWDVRFHHFTGLDQHGYPKLFKNFSDEIIQPLADYGGGSGCGAAWIDEPGFPAGWNNLPYTCDWGRGPAYRHTVRPKGATFEEVSKPIELLKLSRATDLDVDGLSRVYVSSWRGGGFSYSGPDVGFIARVSPKGFTPEPLPDFAKAADGELVKLLESPSHRRRLEAQRTLLRRGLNLAATADLQQLASNKSKPLPSRVAALFALKQGLGEKSHPFLVRLCADASITAWAVRALTDHEQQLASVPARPILAALKSSDARARREAAVSLARLGQVRHAAALLPLLADSEPVVAHTAVQALVRLDAVDACLAAVDRSDAPAERAGALQALQLMHETAVVNGLIVRVEKELIPARSRGLLTALCRLHDTEGIWKGSSWGTRPDTRGPYYQPEEWDQSKRIGDVLLAALNKSEGAEAAFLGGEFARHRLKAGDAVSKLLSLAASDPSVIPALARQLAQADSVPADAVPFLAKAATDDASSEFIRAQAVQALMKSDDAEGFRAAVRAMPRLERNKTEGPESEKARNAFLNSSRLANHHEVFEQVAAQTDPASIWADAILLKLAASKLGSPEAREASTKALDLGWSSSPRRRAQIIDAARLAKDSTRATGIVQALEDPDKQVAAAARNTVNALKLDPEKVRAAARPAGPLIGSLPIEDVLAQVLRIHGEVRRGEQLFTQQGCVSCHTVRADEPLKGPFLGTISTLYKRREIAEAVLLPGKSIAQGFAAHHIELKDGTEVEGFVVQEAADKISLRLITSQEVTVNIADVVRRSKLEKSLMPEKLADNLVVKDLASLIDYLESLGVQK